MHRMWCRRQGQQSAADIRLHRAWSWRSRSKATGRMRVSSAWPYPHDAAAGSCWAAALRSRGHPRKEDLHTVYMRSASLLHPYKLRCWVTMAKARRGNLRHGSTAARRVRSFWRAHSCGRYLSLWTASGEWAAARAGRLPTVSTSRPRSRSSGTPRALSRCAGRFGRPTASRVRPTASRA